ncbi:hypothetical protein CQ062_11695 [Ochrobactrum sp. MYb68]|nr:hypothetical protein CQ062_11695 [Ochrobactrum sp. MYb68]
MIKNQGAVKHTFYIFDDQKKRIKRSKGSVFFETYILLPTRERIIIIIIIYTKINFAFFLILLIF